MANRRLIQIITSTVALILTLAISIQKGSKELHAFLQNTFEQAIDNQAKKFSPKKELIICFTLKNRQEELATQDFFIRNDTLFLVTNNSKLDYKDFINLKLSYQNTLLQNNLNDIEIIVTSILTNIGLPISISINNYNNIEASNSSMVSYRSPMLAKGVFREVRYQLYATYPFLINLYFIPKCLIAILFLQIIATLYLLISTLLYSKKASITSSKIGFKIGNTELDLEKKLLIGNNGQIANLTQQQFKILSLFIENPNNLINKEYLKEVLWNNNYTADKSMWTAILRLRLILNDIQANFEIKNVSKKYYILDFKDKTNNKTEIQRE